MARLFLYAPPSRLVPGHPLQDEVCWDRVTRIPSGFSNGDVPQPRHGLRAALARQVQDAGHVLDEVTGEERRRDVLPSNDIRRPTPDAIWGGAGQMTGP